MRRVWDGLYLECRWALFHGSTVSMEILGCVILLWFGFAIGRPDPLRIDVLTITPLNEYLPLPLVGLVIVLVVAMRLVGIGMQNRYLRLLGALFSVFWWTMFAIDFTIEFPSANIRLGSGLILAAFQSWVAVRVATDIPKNLAELGVAIRHSGTRSTGGRPD